MLGWVVATQIFFHVHPYLTIIFFQMGWFSTTNRDGEFVDSPFIVGLQAWKSGIL